MKKIKLFLSIVSIASLAYGAEPAKPPVFEIRSVLSEPTSSSERMTFSRPSKGGGQFQEVIHVHKEALMDHTFIRTAVVQKDPVEGGYQVELAFSDQGRRRFAEITKQHIGKRLAFLVDGKVYSVPQILAEIPGGKLPIRTSGEDEANQLAAKIDEAVARK